MADKVLLEIEREFVDKGDKHYVNFYLLVPKFNGEVKRLSLFKLDSYAKEFIADYVDLKLNSK